MLKSTIILGYLGLSEALSLSVLIDFPRNKIKCFSRNTRDGIHQLDTYLSGGLCIWSTYTLFTSKKNCGIRHFSSKVHLCIKIVVARLIVISSP